METPATSQQMRDKLKELANNPSARIARIYEALTRVEGYEDPTASGRKDITDSIVLSERLWFSSMLSSTPPAPEDLRAFLEFGRRRVHQGIALASLLRAFRIGMRELWNACALLGEENKDLRGELLFVVSPYLMDYFDQMALLISQAYLDEQYRQARWRESLRHQLHDVVFNHSGDEDAFRATLKALGLDPLGPRIAVALELERFDRNAITSDGELDRLVLAAARHLHAAHDQLVNVWHRDRLLIWVPCEHGEPMNVTDRRMAQGAAALVKAALGIRAIGLGLSGTGAKAWAVSAEEAIRALDLGPNEASEHPSVRPYSDIMIDESVRSTDGTSRYLISLVDQLAAEADVMLTLQTFFANRQRRKVTAAALGIHPNTLDYRLDRIENMVGGSLDDASWIAKLRIALTLHERRG